MGYGSQCSCHPAVFACLALPFFSLATAGLSGVNGDSRLAARRARAHRCTQKFPMKLKI